MCRAHPVPRPARATAMIDWPRRVPGAPMPEMPLDRNILLWVPHHTFAQGGYIVSTFWPTLEPNWTHWAIGDTPPADELRADREANQREFDRRREEDEKWRKRRAEWRKEPTR